MIATDDLVHVHGEGNAVFVVLTVHKGMVELESLRDGYHGMEPSEKCYPAPGPEFSLTRAQLLTDIENQALRCLSLVAWLRKGPAAQKILDEQRRFWVALPDLRRTLADRWVVFYQGEVVSDHACQDDALMSAAQNPGESATFIVDIVAERRLVQVPSFRLVTRS